MSVFVSLDCVRYSHVLSHVFYFDEKGVLYRGKGRRVLRQEAGSCRKLLTLELKSAEKVLNGVDSQNPAIQQLILSYGLPVLKTECGWRRWEREMKAKGKTINKKRLRA